MPRKIQQAAEELRRNIRIAQVTSYAAAMLERNGKGKSNAPDALEDEVTKAIAKAMTKKSGSDTASVIAECTGNIHTVLDTPIVVQPELSEAAGRDPLPTAARAMRRNLIVVAGAIALVVVAPGF